MEAGGNRNLPSVKDREANAAERVERKRWRGEQIKRKEKSGEVG